jgi:hypothetical protein
MDRILSPLALQMMKDMKKALDPKDIFAINNTVYRDDAEETADKHGHH